jgi:predicted dehydrogenase
MNKETRKLRIGILGCGPISQAAHFISCRKAHNAELYAICDQAEDLVSRMIAIHEPQVSYLDYDQMLEDPQVEAIIVAIADQFHVEAARKAIAAGKHVLDPGIAFARHFIQEEMGQMLALKAWYCDSTYRYVLTDNLQPIIMSSSKARRPEGNPKADKTRYFLLAHASHLVDTARFLGGEITSLQARLIEKFGAYCWFVAVEFADRSAGHLDLTVAVRMDWHEGFQVYGEYGSVIGKTYNPWYLHSSDVECFSVRDDQYHRILGEDAHFYKLQIEGFADTILHKAPMRGANIEDGTAAIRALVAISRSVETGQWIQLADVAGGV